MNWDLIGTVAILAVMSFFFLPFYMAIFIAFHKSKIEATFNVMEKMDKKMKDLNFEDAIKHIIEGAEND